MFVDFVGYNVPIYVHTNQWKYCWTVLNFNAKDQLSTNYVPRNHQSLTIHKYWPPRISMIPQYDKIKIHVWSKEINKIQQLFNNNCCSIFLYLFFSKFGQNLKGEGWLCKWLVSTEKSGFVITCNFRLL